MFENSQASIMWLIRNRMAKPTKRNAAPRTGRDTLANFLSAVARSP
ncbi:hypothetical protein RB2654_14580 [Rhodobacterales bacterium HTCC2654]|uniref:Uncharacterized protein n=1 Tax=Maritimibacter alkaliphilus HTCC2654 TaxID=314271 RepID=A3VGW5_9RHOB|nr:hypothetical protein RB2654_14580 [Rhodobacterales bacterium HTCC2654] [Maritimibacter alkaliphilus HTCC2654]